MYAYNSAFQILSANSAPAAECIIQVVKSIAPITSVLDVGCARGTWLRTWHATGCVDVMGVDGPYIDADALEIERERFLAVDLNKRLDMQRSFDLVESMEVAEHLPPARAESFVADLTRHAPMVLFSAATPGQGGENHLNEQPCSYWQAIFKRHGYVAIDCLRPLIGHRAGIPHWYRYNLILYVRLDMVDQLPAFVRQFALPEHEALQDTSPLLYRARKALIRFLPDWACNRLAKWHAHRQRQVPA